MTFVPVPKTHGAIMGAQFGASSGIRSSAEPDSEIHVRETAPREPDPAPSRSQGTGRRDVRVRLKCDEGHG